MSAMRTLPSGRQVFDTGAVLIGLLHDPQRQKDPGSHAEIMQRVLTTPVPKVWHETPREFYVKPSLWQRIRRLFA